MPADDQQDAVDRLRLAVEELDSALAAARRGQFPRAARDVRCWRDSRTDPPEEELGRVLVAIDFGPGAQGWHVEVTLACHVREFPVDYPWWMPMPEPPR